MRSEGRQVQKQAKRLGGWSIGRFLMVIVSL